MKRLFLGITVIAASLAAQTAGAVSIVFSTGNPDGKMAMASRPPNGPSIEIEAADDFLLTTPVSLTNATFVGLVPSGATVSGVAVAIYHVFPLDSDTVRTIHVPTRANSPADTEFVSRDSADGNLAFTTTLLASSFTALNSVLNGIHPSPNQTTLGEGPVTGDEVQFNITFKKPISLPAGHFFFVPQVQLGTGDFYWLSAPKPIEAPGTPFIGDLQAWMRNADLDPDWLRVGADIVGMGAAFNGTFSLVGEGFSTGDPDGLMAMASRPENGGNIEIEAADDFILDNPFGLTGATFVGLLPSGGASVSRVVVEIYRVFPADSDPNRTPHVPTRNNSPSDNALTSRDSGDGNLTVGTVLLNPAFTAANSVLNGINPSPGQHTGGEGAVTGEEVRFNVTFTTPILLSPGHYFFVPQVQLGTGDFYWLSAPKPIVAPGTPFMPDLQAWIRNGNLDPDWLRVGTDIVGMGAFNGAFSLAGDVLTPLELSPAHLWIGLKNSDDQGTQFDLKVELLKNGTPVASGTELCITGVTRNPSKATEAVVPFDSFGDVVFTSGDVLALRVSTRIGTDGEGNKCHGLGGSHNNATGLRLYYDSASRPSRFDATLSPNPNEDLFLHSDGGTCANAPSSNVNKRFLDGNPPTGTNARCKDSGGLNFAGGNPFSVIGTWSLEKLP